MWAHHSIARSMGWSQGFGAKGVPICVSGCVWVERLEPEITLLTDVLKVVTDLVVITRDAGHVVTRLGGAASGQL